MTTAVKERPILFSGEMVRAILEGRKTQTRRIITCGCNVTHGDMLLGDWSLSRAPYRYDGEGQLWRWKGRKAPEAGLWIEECQTDVDDHATYPVRCPYGKPGDHLWVRETWQKSGLGWGTDLPVGKVHYRATDQGEWKDCWGKWKPSIHMPRWASRITLEVISVRVERLQEISEDDTDAEGFGGDFPNIVMPDIFGSDASGHTLVECFAKLWDKINGKLFPWASNPWVWVVEFKRIK